MNAVRLLLGVGVCFALTSCATAPNSPSPGLTQELLLETEPAGANCSIQQGGAVVAAVDATPGVATVRRDLCSAGSDSACWLDPRDSIARLDIVCRKDGYFEYREALMIETSHYTERAGSGSSGSAGRAATGILGLAAMSGAPGLAAAAVAAPMVVFPALGVGALAAAVANSSKDNFYFYYPSPPKFILTPSTFETEAARDAFFVNLESKLERAAATQRTHLDSCSYVSCECQGLECSASDRVCPLPSPDCDRGQAQIDSRLKSQLDQIRALREQVRIVSR